MDQISAFTAYINEAVITGLTSPILLEQNGEEAVPCGRYITLEYDRASSGFPL